MSTIKPVGDKFPADREDFLKRQKAALADALIRNRVNFKQLAYAVGYHRDSIEGWATGKCVMSGDAIEACQRFFLSLGDLWFFHELYGELGVERAKRALLIEQRAREARLSKTASWIPEPERKRA